MTDQPTTFVNMMKRRSEDTSAANDERCQVLLSRVSQDGSIDRFKVFRNNVEDHDGHIGPGNLFE
jgi:hypothetical protein